MFFIQIVLRPTIRVVMFANRLGAEWQRNGVPFGNMRVMQPTRRFICEIMWLHIKPVRILFNRTIIIPTMYVSNISV